jgi:hypothetical protein
MNYLDKIPTRYEILSVYSLILFIVFSWTIFRILFQIPSWLYSHSKTGIVFLAAYVFSFALFESTLLLSFILLVSLILPAYIFRERFVAQGSLLVFACTAWALIVQFQREYLVKRDLLELGIWILVFLLSLLIILFFSNLLMRRNKKAQTLIEAFTDRMIIFAWLYIPVGLIALTIVMVRNII